MSKEQSSLAFRTVGVGKEEKMTKINGHIIIRSPFPKGKAASGPGMGSQVWLGAGGPH